MIMGPYQQFANYYDILTENVNYRERAGYFDQLLKRYHNERGILLDLACGTGGLSIPLSQMGYDVIGVDGSSEMLSFAMSKAGEAQQQILFLCQRMDQLDLYGTVDATICALDSLNHVTDLATLQQILERVSLFTNPGGIFLFDVNTPYKHREILANNVYVYDCPEVYCVWQNEYQEQDQVVNIQLDFFQPQGKGSYRRSTESFQERAYSQEILTQLLEQAGFGLLDLFEGDTFHAPTPTTQRWVLVAEKL